MREGYIKEDNGFHVRQKCIDLFTKSIEYTKMDLIEGTQMLKSKEDNIDEFVEEFGSFIHKTVKGTGILAGTLISQAILESSGKDSSGNWKVGGSKLSREAVNYFGIKSNNGWKGRIYNIDTGEVYNGNKVIVNANFRAYNNVKDSIKDYVSFLKSNGRYAQHGVFEAKTVSEQAKRLKEAGYATSSNYADTVNKIYLAEKPIIDESYKQYKNKQVVKIIGLSILYVSIITGSIYFWKKLKK